MTRFVLNKIISVYLLQRLLSILLVAAISMVISQNSSARDNPGWGNAALVCDSPRIGGDDPNLSFKGTKPTFETGFYHIGRLPDPENRYLGVAEDNAETVLLLPAETYSPTEWLLTQVGSDLYQISTCRNGKPRCLTLSNLGKYPTARLAQCEHEAYGSQVWWNIGILLGPGKGGWEFGNDNASRMDCLTEMPDTGVPFLKSCDHSGKPAHTWRVEPVQSVKSAPAQTDTTPAIEQKQGGHITISNFPKGAEVITYQCDSGQIVKALYDSQADQVQVSYENQILKLDNMISASGAKFGGPNAPWGWWTKGDQGFIYTPTANGLDLDFIESCKEIVQDTAHLPAQVSTPSIDPNRMWIGNGFKEEIILSDCNGCGDDVGMTIACQGTAKPALVTVNWAATENQSQAKTLIIDVNDQTFERVAFSTYNGMLGHVPQFFLQRDDPLIGAFKKGSVAKITFGGVVTHISLKGSQSAFDVFNVHCGWNQPIDNTSTIPTPTTTGSSLTDPSSQVQGYSDGPAWHLSEYFDDQKNQQVSHLIYGIPETDAFALVAQCDRNSNTAVVDFSLDTGNLKSGSPYYVRLQAGDIDHTYLGQVFSESSEYSGVRLSIPGADTFWMALAQGETVYVIPQIGEDLVLNHTDSIAVARTWLDRCAN